MAGPGTLIGGVVAVGVGEAASTALDPVLEPQRQAAWAKSQARIFDLGTLAELVAQGLLSEPDAIAEGRKNGYAKGRVQRAIQLALKAAPVAELLELWRRGEFGDPTTAASQVLVDHGLAKAGIEPQYWEHIKHLFYGRLDPADVARAIQRGVMDAPFDLPYTVPAKVGKIAAFPVSPLDAAEQARAHGMTVEQLRVLTALVGLPLALDQAARATFRNIIDLDDYDRAVLEGNTRGEWGRAALNVAREILTAGQYAELQLRGFYDETTRRKNTEKHGMTDADSDLLYNVLGRSVSVHQVTTGLARGGKYPSVYADVPQPYRAAIQRSNIREEWVGIAYANRYSYPSAFVLRSLAQAGDLGDAAAVKQILLEIGWPPALAEKVSLKWVPTGSATDPLVRSARTSLVTALRKAYVLGDEDEAAARSILTAEQVDATTQDSLIATWNRERSITRRELTPSQLKKAMAEGITNPATGAPFTKDEVVAELVLRGYSSADANVFLET